MSETEIALAQAYLKVSGQDPVSALIRSVRDLARTRRILAHRLGTSTVAPGGEPSVPERLQDRVATPALLG